MKSLADVLTDRANEMRSDPLYRRRLALRDERDFSNDEVPDEKPKEIVHRHSDMSKREYQRLEEHDRMLKYLMQKKDTTGTKYIKYD